MGVHFSFCVLCFFFLYGFVLSNEWYCCYLNFAIGRVLWKCYNLGQYEGRRSYSSSPQHYNDYTVKNSTRTVEFDTSINEIKITHCDYFCMHTVDDTCDNPSWFPEEYQCSVWHEECTYFDHRDIDVGEWTELANETEATAGCCTPRPNLDEVLTQIFYFRQHELAPPSGTLDNAWVCLDDQIVYYDCYDGFVPAEEKDYNCTDDGDAYPGTGYLNDRTIGMKEFKQSCPANCAEKLTCLNGGNPDTYCSECDCKSYWGGDDCSTCTLGCKNGGDHDDDCTECICVGNFGGWLCKYCELDCGHGVDADDCTTCVCDGYYTGEHCDVCDDPCVHGTIIWGCDKEIPSCECDDGYHGDFCELREDETTTPEVPGILCHYGGAFEEFEVENVGSLVEEDRFVRCGDVKEYRGRSVECAGWGIDYFTFKDAAFPVQQCSPVSTQVLFSTDKFEIVGTYRYDGVDTFLVSAIMTYKECMHIKIPFEWEKPTQAFDLEGDDIIDSLITQSSKVYQGLTPQNDKTPYVVLVETSSYLDCFVTTITDYTSRFFAVITHGSFIKMDLIPNFLTFHIVYFGGDEYDGICKDTCTGFNRRITEDVADGDKYPRCANLTYPYNISCFADCSKYNNTEVAYYHERAEGIYFRAQSISFEDIPSSPATPPTLNIVAVVVPIVVAFFVCVVSCLCVVFCFCVIIAVLSSRKTSTKTRICNIQEDNDDQRKSTIELEESKNIHEVEVSSNDEKVGSETRIETESFETESDSFSDTTIETETDSFGDMNIETRIETESFETENDSFSDASIETETDETDSFIEMN